MHVCFEVSKKVFVRMIFIVYIIAVSRICIVMAQSGIPYSACLIKPTSPMAMQSQRTKCAVAAPVSAVLVNSKGSSQVCNDLTVTSSDVIHSHVTSTGDGTGIKRECGIDEISVPNVLQLESSTDTHDISDMSNNIQDTTVSTSQEHLNFAEPSFDSERQQTLDLMHDSSENFLSDIDIPGLINDETAGTVNRKRAKKHDDRRARKESKPTRPKPNSFVAVQISSPVIRERLKEVQDAIVKHDKQLTKVLTSLQKLHITLMVIRMDTDEEVEMLVWIIIEGLRVCVIASCIIAATTILRGYTIEFLLLLCLSTWLPTKHCTK